jgi:ubiquinone/menaquinone biosynthesis C-methylase UbiE
MSIPDPHQYKLSQRKDWDSVANSWQKWWKTTETAAAEVSRRLIELAEIKPGSRVLDLATGIGEPSLTVAHEVGTDGHVLAVDISSEMLHIAKERAISLGLQGIVNFKEGDAETIDLTSSTFDAALCRFGLMFLPDLKAGLDNIYKSLVHGGHLAAAVWASPNKVPFISLALNTVLKETNNQLPAGIPGPFSLSDENILKAAFIEAGFEDISIERMNVVFDFDSADTFANFTYETTAPIQAILAHQTVDRRKDVLETVAETVRKHVGKSSGSICLYNEAICIVGRR